MLKYTRLGKAMRATSANPNLARNSGVKTQRIIATTWLISGALCGLAGTVFAMNTGVFEATSAQLYIVLLLAAMFLGGPGEPYGAMLGAMTIGIATEVSAAYISPQYKEVVAFLVLLGMLTFRPYGIFGSEKTALMSAYAFYLATIIVYGAVDAMACLALNVEFGFAGISNFGFIIFQSAGAYTAAVLSMPRAATSNGGFQQYVLGWSLPWPLPWIGAAIVGGLIALPFVFLVGKRLRGDFAAVGLLVSAVLLNLLVKNYVPFLNGDAGISIVPAPFQSIFDPQGLGLPVRLRWRGGRADHPRLLPPATVTESPYGRSLRAMRDNDIVADSLGKNLRLQRTTTAGARRNGGRAERGDPGRLHQPLGAGAWGYAETIVLFAAIIVGGAGNHKGAILGAILVPLGFEEITRLPARRGQPDARAGPRVGGHRPAHHPVPVVPPLRDPARAAPHPERRATTADAAAVQVVRATSTPR